MRKVFAALFLMMSFSANSGELAGLLNVEKSLETQISDAVKFASANFRDVHVSYVSQMGDLTEQQHKEIEKVYVKGSLYLLNIVDIKPIANLWQDAIRKKFTEQEIIEIVKFYESPIGIRFVEAINEENSILLKEFYRVFEINYKKFVTDYEVQIFNASICCEDQK